jgi:hypothetical protein
MLMDWLSRDHMGTPTEKETMFQEQRNGALYVVHAKML